MNAFTDFTESPICIRWIIIILMSVWSYQSLHTKSCVCYDVNGDGVTFTSCSNLRTELCETSQVSSWADHPHLDCVCPDPESRSQHRDRHRARLGRVLQEFQQALEARELVIHQECRSWINAKQLSKTSSREIVNNSHNQLYIVCPKSMYELTDADPGND